MDVHDEQDHRESSSVTISLRNCTYFNDVQGIYPTLIIILVHSQKSCLEESMVSTRLRSSTHFTPSSNGSRGVWPASRKRQNEAHAIEINVHEMRNMDGSRGGETASVVGAESTVDELVKGNGVEKSSLSISPLNEPV